MGRSRSGRPTSRSRRSAPSSHDPAASACASLSSAATPASQPYRLGADRSADPDRAHHSLVLAVASQPVDCWLKSAGEAKSRPGLNEVSNQAVAALHDPLRFRVILPQHEPRVGRRDRGPMSVLTRAGFLIKYPARTAVIDGRRIVRAGDSARSQFIDTWSCARDTKIPMRPVGLPLRNLVQSEQAELRG